MLTTLLSATLGCLLLLGPPTCVFAQESLLEMPVPAAAETIGTTTEGVMAPDDPASVPIDVPSSTELAPDESMITETATTTASSEDVTVPPLTAPTSTAATTTQPIVDETLSTTSTERPPPEQMTPLPISISTIDGFASSTAPTSSLLCLAIVAPAPNEGPEWIAVYGLTPSTSASFLDWSFADAQGSLVKINASTTLIWDEGSQTMRYELRSARLNNNGDTVFLKTPEELVHDTFVYPETERGHRWVRDGCMGEWESFPRPIVTTVEAPVEQPISPPAAAPLEPGPAIVMETLPELDGVAAVVSEPAPFVTVPPEATRQKESNARQTFLRPPPARIVEPSQTEEPPKKVIVATKKAAATTKKPASVTETPTRALTTTKMAAKAAAKPAKKTTTVKKSATKKPATTKTTPPIPSLLMPPLLENPEEFQGVRVRLRGRVASQTNFLGAHTFVVVNEDGRGLLIKGTSKHPSPTFGSWIELTGSVVWNDAGLTIKQAAADTWEIYPLGAASTSEAFPMRTVDLLRPSQEEAWSLARVEGRVSAVQKTSFDLDVGDVSVRVRLVARLGYRAQRLQVGDTVAIQGLLDLRSEEPTILPQTLESIEIVKRALPPAPAAKTPVEQPWLPVGAAAGTLALSEGWRRFHAYRKQRHEAASFRKLLETSGKERG